MRIGIDIDGVLMDLEAFLKDYATKYNYEKGIKNQIVPGFYEEQKVFGWSKEETLEFWEKYLAYYVMKYPARAFAKEAIQKLKQTNEIYIITARNEWGLSEEYKGKMQELTKKWLKDQGIVYDNLIFSKEDKLPICLENQIDRMIDDSPYVLEQVATQIKALCFHASYNEKINHKNITRVYSWYDVLEKIEEFN